MNKNDWYEAGDQIKKLVQDAVDSGDFSQLGNTIANVVNDTVEGLQTVLKENLGNAQQSGSAESGSYGTGRSPRNEYEYSNREAADRIRRNMDELREKRRNRVREEAERTARARNTAQMHRPVKAKLRVPGEISGQVMKWTGYSFSSMFGLSLGILGVVSLTTGIMLSLPMGFLALFFGASMCLGISGGKKVSLAKRFRRYKEILGERTYCLVEELANAVGQSHRFVQKDLKKMISRGLFTEGYLDRKETLLITDKSTYQHYLTSQAEYEKRGAAEELSSQNRKHQKSQEKSEAAFADETSPNRKLSPEHRELIEEGKRYIQHVHDCNERIPDETMSAKLDRLELVITRIFREAEKDPEVVDELKKLMSYYLPTTKKLLDAYCEMDMQPIRGQNIENTKKEIENALDTVNTAFENLLDSLFEETAWDISSDISVLNTMLAQEGLTGKDFSI